MTNDVATDDGRARVQCEDIANERIGFTVNGDHVGDLDDPILVGFGKNTWKNSSTLRRSAQIHDFNRQQSKQSAPLRPAHSMSKPSIRKGATSAHCPSGECDFTRVQATSTSIWHLRISLYDNFKNIIWIKIVFEMIEYLETGCTALWRSRICHGPGESSIQLQPTMSASIMYLIMMTRKSNVIQSAIEYQSNVLQYRISKSMLDS